MIDNKQLQLFKIQEFQFCRVTIVMPIDSLFFNQVCTTLATNPLVFNIQCHCDYNCDKFKFMDDLLYFEERKYILEGAMYLHIFQTYHDF